MRATYLLVVFVAFSAAAQDKQAGASTKRCGGSSGKSCKAAEVCVGVKEFKDGLGVCVPPKSCSNFGGDVCSNKTDHCLPDPRIACPPGVQDCGGGLCVPKGVIEKIGLKKK